MSLLQARNLRKTYAGRTVVNGVSFHVEPAEIVGLLGRNGAGKTTSFRMTIGMIEADEGHVLLDGVDVSGLPMYMRARLGMGYLSQEPSVFGRMTCQENLLAILETLPIPRAEQRQRATELLAQFGLTHKARQAARTCSGGERRKLEIARSLITSPRLILLDEPFSGVDPIAVEDLQREIRRLSGQGIACLITDHNVQQTLRVCDRAYIIDDGKVFAEGTPHELVNDEMVRRVYLGSLFRGDEFAPPPQAVPTPAPPGRQPRPAPPPQLPLSPAPAPGLNGDHTPPRRSPIHAAAAAPDAAPRAVPLQTAGSPADYYLPVPGSEPVPKQRVVVRPVPARADAPTVKVRPPQAPPAPPSPPDAPA